MTKKYLPIILFIIVAVLGAFLYALTHNLDQRSRVARDKTNLFEENGYYVLAYPPQRASQVEEDLEARFDGVLTKNNSFVYLSDLSDTPRQISIAALGKYDKADKRLTPFLQQVPFLFRSEIADANIATTDDHDNNTDSNVDAINVEDESLDLAYVKANSYGKRHELKQFISRHEDVVVASAMNWYFLLFFVPWLLAVYFFVVSLEQLKMVFSDSFFYLSLVIFCFWGFSLTISSYSEALLHTAYFGLVFVCIYAYYQCILSQILSYLMFFLLSVAHFLVLAHKEFSYLAFLYFLLSYILFAMLFLQMHKRKNKSKSMLVQKGQLNFLPVSLLIIFFVIITLIPPSANSSFRYDGVKYQLGQLTDMKNRGNALRIFDQEEWLVQENSFNLNSYILNRAYQQGFLYGRPYQSLSRNETIDSFIVKEDEEGLGYEEEPTVLYQFTDTWFDSLKADYLTNPWLALIPLK